jgi:hypothetical protein
MGSVSGEVRGDKTAENETHGDSGSDCRHADERQREQRRSKQALDIRAADAEIDAADFPLLKGHLCVEENRGLVARHREGRRADAGIAAAHSVFLGTNGLPTWLSVAADTFRDR